MNVILCSEFCLLTPILFGCEYTTLAFIIVFITNADSSSIKNNSSPSRVHGFRVQCYMVTAQYLGVIARGFQQPDTVYGQKRKPGFYRDICLEGQIRDTAVYPYIILLKKNE